MFNGGHRFFVEEKKGVNSRGLIMNYLCLFRKNILAQFRY